MPNHLLLAAALVATFSTSSAIAQPAIEKIDNEPTEMIKKFEATGARLGKRRICATASE